MYISVRALGRYEKNDIFVYNWSNYKIPEK